MKWIDALFARFARIWPVAWAETCRAANLDDLAQEWSEGLAGLSGEDIGRGIERARKESTWAPSIADFRRFARDGWEHRSAAYREVRPSFLLQNGTAEAREIAAKQAFLEIRERLNSKQERQ